MRRSKFSIVIFTVLLSSCVIYEKNRSPQNSQDLRFVCGLDVRDTAKLVLEMEFPNRDNSNDLEIISMHAVRGDLLEGAQASSLSDRGVFRLVDTYSQCLSTEIVEYAKYKEKLNSELQDLILRRPLEVNTFFATNRKFEKGIFTHEISPDLSYGISKTTIPPIHDIGNIERPKSRFIVFKEQEDPEKHVVLHKTEVISEADFQERLLQSPGAILVFVHGFRVTFDQAARQTAQLHRDLRFQGRSMFFSWPSDGETAGYVNDSTKIADSVNGLADFVELLATNESVSEIFLLGHSMGSRALTRALLAVKDEIDESAKLKFNELILIEPDMSQKIFTSIIAPGLRDLGARVTIYASENDKALGISRSVNNNVPRLGQAGKYLFTAPGFETIDSSDVGDTLLGVNHSEYAQNLVFLHDLSDLIEGKSAPKRLGLKRKRNHWWLIP